MVVFSTDIVLRHNCTCVVSPSAYTHPTHTSSYLELPALPALAFLTVLLEQLPFLTVLLEQPALPALAFPTVLLYQYSVTSSISNF